MYTFTLKIYGCQMNVYDGDKLRTALISRGWREVEEDEADMVLIVGCSIRDKAEHKVWSELGRYSERWEACGKPAVCVLGCLAQNVGKEMSKRFPWVRLVAGPRNIGNMPEAIERAAAGSGKAFLLDENPRDFHDLHVAPLERSNPWKAYVTIAHGCDNFCTYCIVPYVRGRFVSRLPGDIIKEVRMLIDGGVKEISLLGQNVNSYGTDFEDGYRFSNLLRDLGGLDGLHLLRFMTCHPKDFTPDVVDALVEFPNICPGINLPIQSGNNRILKKMNRGYTVEDYAEIVERIQSHLPEVGLTSDIIVGFPTETEEEFQDSLSAVKRFNYDLVHTAAYSPRKGTPGATMEGQIPYEEKRRRLNMINELQSKIAFDINQKLVGRNYRILLDGMAPKGEELVQGRTNTDKVVICPGRREDLGHFAEVRIERAEHWCLHGKILSILD